MGYPSSQWIRRKKSDEVRPSLSSYPVADIAASSSPTQQETPLRDQKPAKHRLSMQDPDTASLDSVSQFIAECADSEAEDDLLPSTPLGKSRTIDLDAEILRLLNGEDSPENGVADEESGSSSSQASLTSIHVDHDNLPLTGGKAVEELTRKEEGRKVKPNAFYILYGPDEKRNSGKVKISQASVPSSEDGSPGIPKHPMSIRSGALTAGSEIYIDLEEGGRGSRAYIISSSSSEDEDEGTEIGSGSLPKPLEQELQEAQRPPIASRKDQKSSQGAGVGPPLMNEMRMLLESLADTESDFSSVSSSDNNEEDLHDTPEHVSATSGSEPQEPLRLGGKAAQLPPVANINQQNHTQPMTKESLTFDMLAMTTSEVSIATSVGEDEEETANDRDRSIRRQTTSKLRSNPMPAAETGRELTLDELAIESESEPSVVSTGSEEGSRTSTLRRAEGTRGPTQEEEKGKEKEEEEEEEEKEEKEEEKEEEEEEKEEEKEDEEEEEEEEEEKEEEEEEERGDTSKGSWRTPNGRMNLGEMLAELKGAGVTLDTPLPVLTPPSTSRVLSPRMHAGETRSVSGREDEEEDMREARDIELGSEEHLQGLNAMRKLAPKVPSNHEGVAEMGSQQHGRLLQWKTEPRLEIEETDSHHPHSNPPRSPTHDLVSSVTTDVLTGSCSLRSPQVFSGSLHDRTQPQIPIRPPKKQQSTELTDHHSAGSFPTSSHVVPVEASPRPVPKPRKKISAPLPPVAESIPTVPARPVREAETASIQKGPIEVHVHRKPAQGIVRTDDLVQRSHQLELETPWAAGIDVQPGMHSLAEKVCNRGSLV